MLLRELREYSGILPWLVGRLADPRRADLVTYPWEVLLRTVLVLFGQGWRDQDDADALCFNPALWLVVAGERSMASLEDRPPPSVSADAVAPARHPEHGCEPAHAARTDHRTSRPAVAGRTARASPAPPDHRR